MFFALRLLTGTVLLVLLTEIAGAQDRAAPSEQQIDSIFRELTPDAPGCAAAASRNGTVLFNRTYGLANLETGTPITARTVFPVASISKQFTAMAVLLLERGGLLSLDDDVRKHIPELHDFGARVTIGDLLAHTSGLRDHWEILRIERGWLFEYRVKKGDALDVILRQRELNHAPGEDWYYSATGYTLAALIVERLTGKSFRDFTQERIFTPLGMADTHFQDDYTAVIEGRATSYYRGADGKWRWILPNHDVVGPTGLISTPLDLLRWHHNFARPIVGDSAMLRALTREVRLRDGEPTGYGLGVFLEEHGGTPFITHGGDDAAYHSASGHFPEHDLAIAVTCNGYSADATGFQERIADLLLPATAPADSARPASVALSRAVLSHLAGVYVDPNKKPVFITLRGDSLIFGQSSGPVLLPLSETRFRRADRPIELEFPGDGRMIMHRPYFPRRVVHIRQALASPSPAQLREYCGMYEAEELSAVYRVSVGDSVLHVLTPGRRLRVWRPVYGDYFDGPDQASFTRDAAGQINGFLLHNVRLRNLRFVRSAGCAEPTKG